jgi:DNA polymerase-1
MRTESSERGPQKVLYLIDGSSYIHRAYHAIKGLSNSQGMPTNAAFGFTRMLMKLLEDRNPLHMAVLFDARGKTFRHELYSDYKANRPPMPEDLALQIPYIKAITKGFNIPSIETPGFEADDIIGTLAQQAESAGFSVVIVSGDKDFAQLVSDRISIFDPMKDKMTTLETVRQEFGLEPAQVVEFMGLSGDSSDNIPGVAGIGPKTARELIKSFGSIETLYSQIDSVKSPKQKQNLLRCKEQAHLSRQLATICLKVPLSFDPDSFALKAPDEAALSRLFKTLEFRELQKSFMPSPAGPMTSYSAILDRESLETLVERLEASERFAIDTETTSRDPMKAKLVGISFSMLPDEAFYIPLGHSYIGVPEQLPMNDVLKRLKPVLENPAVKKIGQNIKYDWLVLERYGICLKGVCFDTMVASYLINPSKRSHSLDQIALDFLNHHTISFQDVAGKGKKTLTFDCVLLEKAVPYACEDADVTLKAYRILVPRLQEIELTSLFENVELPLIPVLMRMEKCGITVDKDCLLQISKEFFHQLQQIEQDIYRQAGRTFNINSSQQLGDVLFEKLGLPVQKKTQKKTAYSTDVAVLTALAPLHELPALVLRHRTLAKLKSTYADALLELVHPETGRIHTSYNQTVTATGRLSSSEPNLQNIPIRTEEGRRIRSAFIPRSGWLILSADYSQIELRILAHYSKDPILVNAFREGEDIHARTAAEMFEIAADKIPSELRRQAKVINFGIIYGMGPFRLSNELGITQKMAKTYIDNYFKRYQGVKQFIDQAVRDAETSGRTSTLLGRIRLLPDINSTNRVVKSAAERTAINTPIQGTAADLIKLAMIRVDWELRRKKLKTTMLLSVHDELVFELPPEELEVTRKLVKTVMETVWDLMVPLKTNIQWGTNWAEAHA